MPSRKEGQNSDDRVKIASDPVAVPSERHPTDRPSMWGGVSLMLLSGVLFLNGIGETTVLSAALGGLLAMLME